MGHRRRHRGRVQLASTVAAAGGKRPASERACFGASNGRTAGDASRRRKHHHSASRAARRLMSARRRRVTDDRPPPPLLDTKPTRRLADAPSPSTRDDGVVRFVVESINGARRRHRATPG